MKCDNLNTEVGFLILMVQNVDEIKLIYHNINLPEKQVKNTDSEDLRQ